MAQLIYCSSMRKVLLLYLVFFLCASVFLCTWSESDPFKSSPFGGRRRKMLGVEAGTSDEEEKAIKPKKKSPDTLSPKNQTKPIKTGLSSKNQTKPAKTSNLSSKNQTKSGKTTTTNELKKLNSTTINIKKLNSTTSKIKKLNSTKPISVVSIKKALDLTKPSSPKNKTTKPTTTKKTQYSESDPNSHPGKLESEKKNKPNKQNFPKKQTGVNPSWIDEEDDGDLVSEFADLPMKFQKTLIPDLERISITSKAYLSKANKEFTKGFKPIVGNKYAPTIASVVSFAFILIPLLLVSLIFNRIKAYFSLQKLLIFIQVYISIYFAILSLSALITGLEPLRFFYATSQSTYVCIQVLQTLGYVLYLLLLLMYLILVFSTDCGLGSKLLGLAQTFVGFAVGLHYYVAVFHRVVLRQPPKTNWKVHGIYATCFFLICLGANAERRKKAYLVDGGEEGKKS
ncbi:cell wall integrity/stress response component-like protein [Parasponia andersonii]|uniref:Cell wall integrity/stress response component-like protein n=1 Tax=Parasponia andersonii TaxID=3476 RepID=A0A2P5C1V2_PARAD|nr:cell wall integrity/stress response component-like protein [Parasponia andersonii]